MKEYETARQEAVETRKCWQVNLQRERCGTWTAEYAISVP